jgi:quercetin dioxygenase-like cupin family protein
MSAPDRLREHPQTRFGGAAQCLDLAAAARALRAEDHAAVSGHRQITLHQHGMLTQVLFVFDAGGELKEHRVDGAVTLHVLGGRLGVTAPGVRAELAAGQMLVLAPGAPHTVLAAVPAEMLLTVCREPRALVE